MRESSRGSDTYSWVLRFCWCFYQFFVLYLRKLHSPLQSDSRRSEFGTKVGALFPTAMSMAADGLWKDCMRVLNKVFKICNMHVERCLARGRLCVQQSDTVPVIEKVRAASMLNEVLTAHFGQGGRDPRFTTSKSLLEKGVPLRRGKVKRKIIKRSSGYSRFFGKLCACGCRQQ